MTIEFSFKYPNKKETTVTFKDENNEEYEIDKEEFLNFLSSTDLTVGIIMVEGREYELINNGNYFLVGGQDYSGKLGFNTLPDKIMDNILSYFEELKDSANKKAITTKEYINTKLFEQTNNGIVF